MPADTFICGSCQTTFNDISLFIEHKKQPCESAQEEEMHIVQQADDASTMHIVAEAVDTSHETDKVQEGTIEGATSVQHVQLIQVPVSEGIRLTKEQAEAVVKAASQSGSLLEGTGPTFLKLTSPVVHHESGEAIQVQQVTPKTPGRKRGRPRKGEGKKPLVVEKPVTETKDASVSIGNDGRLHCPRCRRTFTRLRHYNSHRCLANSEYVDISKKEAVPGLENDADSGPENIDLDDEVIIARYSPRAKKVKTEHVPSSEVLQGLDSGEHAEPNVTIEMDGQTELEASQSVVTYASSTTATIKERPIFETNEEKVEFEQNLNVDLSQIDHMFKTHIIEQNVNEHAPPPANRISPELTIFSCNTCDKVFKTISHMRHHCLIHTNLKPFRCPKCTYASNSKGNLYTHIRKHTGQFFSCTKCKFKTVNKSHLNEHMGTHSVRKIKCSICKKDYSTNKSLYNHVRKYHGKTQEGAEYLKEFTPRVNKGQAVLHQCHVCNRKFKKRMDRDRHLFIHNIKANPNVFACELCDYTASRRVYLENHIRKHRIIYQCAACHEKFLSTIRLNDHISEKHLGDVAPQPTEKDWGDLFEASINCSLYLPEPDGSIDHLGQAYVVKHDVKNTEVVIEGAKEDTQALFELKDAIEESIEEQSGEAVEVTQIIQELNTPLQTEQEEMQGTVEEQPLAGDDAPVEIEGTDAQDAVPDIQPESSTEAPVQVKEELLETEGAATGDGADETCGQEEAMEGPESSNEPGIESMEGPVPRHLLGTEDEERNQDIYNKLQYQAMNMDVLTKLRETFGNQECEFCGRLFYSQLDYEPHLRTHTGDKPFACEDCEYRSITRENLKRHCEKHHQHISLKCDKCDYVAGARTQLWTHQHKHKEAESPSNICPICQSVFASKKALGAHILTKHPTMSRAEAKKVTGYNHRMQGKIGRRSYKCPYCDKVFTRANSDLQKHIWIHEGIKPFKCSLCPHACRSMNNLKSHMLRHSQTKPFMCGDCGKLYKSRTALRWHMRSHREGRIFKCSRCPYEAIQKSHLKRHMETHEVIKKYMCEYCDYSANTLGYMKIHHTKFHKDLPQQSVEATTSSSRELPPNTKAFKCLSCDYIFGNIWDIKRHLKVRHHLHVEDIRALETTEVSRIVPADVVSGQEAEMGTGVEVIEVDNLPADSVVHTQTAEDDAREALETLQYSTVPTADNDVDEKTQSAVNILQQIIDMSQQGTFPSQSQQITVQTGQDGQIVSVNPETIILQQDGQELVVSSEASQALQSGEFVIQVMNEENCVMGQETVVTSSQALPHTVTIPEGVTEVLSVSPGNEFFQTVQEDVNVITSESNISS
ncbi:zinc finger protein ZFAT-like [Lineus longissimus]|uniref:zinc finger protein ZFAT-like n=1 Tax=Lineus longissimus TaxID=88925 RepID=UPI002B4CDF7C